MLYHGGDMEAFRKILLRVWREACRHIEITRSTETIARLLMQQMPVEQIQVRRLAAVRGCLETVACSPRVGPLCSPESSGVLGKEQVASVMAWCRRGEVLHANGGGSPDERHLPFVPEGLSGEVLAGPLHTPDGMDGVLLLVSGRGERFEERHVEMARILLEPFSAALENDARLREMEVLREAAEAEKQSLLTRLGRTELGDTIVGDGLRSVMERVELVAPSDVPVLLFGETGTGKELVARVIHRRSGRSGGPVIRVNCGAIPPELIDAQLFGHERGAFTGASEARKGWFERADGGTLFLDEIGELPLAAQVRLLRILQDGWLERIGGHQPVHVNVRVVAATHRDLALMVSEGRFREDVWYRIAVFPILLPPLRDRVDDIPVLARHFAARAATRFGLPLLMPTDEDLALLMSYRWPGNVRELGAVMDRAAIIGNGERLEVAKALGLPRPGGASGGRASEPALRGRGEPGGPAVLPLDEVVRGHICQVLAQTKGRVEGPYGAARLLGVNPHTLRARMRKLGIDWGAYRAR